MTRLELRWAEDLLAAFAPAGGPGLAPQRGEVRYAAVLARMRNDATPLAALGLRLALWVAALSPLWLWGRLRTASRLTESERPELLRQLLRHRWYAVRELTTLLKMVAMMALLGTESVRARSGYDNVQSQARVESGVRVRLPLLHEAGAAAQSARAHEPTSASDGEAERPAQPRAVAS